MAKLIYLANMSLDGYIEDRHGAFDFGPLDDDDVFAAAYTDLLRTVGTFLYGRRLYETMAGWETMPALAARSCSAVLGVRPGGRTPRVSSVPALAGVTADPLAVDVT